MKKISFFNWTNIFLLYLLMVILLLGNCILKNKENKNIRVLITTENFSDYYHDSIQLQYDEMVYEYDKNSFINKKDTIESENGVLVLNLKRAGGNPLYQGKIELTGTEKGIVMINDLPIEQYLEGVVPSEMPSTYNIEALKAQAVCARTYAYKQLEKNNLLEFQADVDDSVNYQVYNNYFSEKEIQEAVEKTKNEVLLKDGELIEAYYFSTSSGKTDTNEVWGSVEALSYLKSVECKYDMNLPWSEWETYISWDELRKRIQENYDLNFNNIEITILKRSQSGTAMEMEITTNTIDNVIMIKGEYNIRSILRPQDYIVNHKKEKISEMNLLPSACFEIITDNNGICVKGKGYGHGVGMSQNGANEMAKEGYTYRDILEYFYNEIEIGNIDEIAIES